MRSCSEKLTASWYVEGEKKGHSRIRMQEEMGVTMYLFIFQKKTLIKMLAEKLLLQVFLLNRVLRALSRLPTCANLKQRKLGMQPGKQCYPLVSTTLKYRF